MTSDDRARSFVSDSLINEYKENGAVCIRQLLTKDEIELLRRGIDENLSNPSPRFKVASREDDTGRFVEDFCMWERNPYYKEFIYQSPCAAVAGLLMKSSISRLYHDHLLVKDFWIPIDPVSRYSTLEFVSGSHYDGRWFMPRTFLNSEAKWFPEGTLENIPSIDANRDAFPIIGWPVQLGDVIAFHMVTLHGARGTTLNDERRRIYSIRFLGNDIKHKPRTWNTSTDLSNITKDIPTDHPINHTRFPIIYK